MPFHVMLEAGAQRRAFALNVSEDFLQARLLEPWARGEEFVLAGQHWEPRQTRTTIYETTSPVALDGGAEFQTWTLLVLPAGSDRTDELLQRPAGPKAVESAGGDVYAEDRRKVMVVLGRNAAAGRAVFEFLRAIDLRPLEWTELVGSVNAGAPYIGEVLDSAFAQAQAVVVLATPDDVAYLRSDLLPDGDPDDEGTWRGQARPNVYFEAGMALGRFPTRTVLTELGTLRPASDLGGRHAVRLNNNPACRKDLAQRLEKAGCLVNTSGDAWLTAGDFSPPRPVAGVGHGGEGAVSDSLVARARAMRDDLGGRRGFVEIGLADTYNDLVTESGIRGMPLAERREPTGHDQLIRAPMRAKMTAEEMYTHLGQLIARRTTSPNGDDPGRTVRELDGRISRAAYALANFDSNPEAVFYIGSILVECEALFDELGVKGEPLGLVSQLMHEVDTDTRKDEGLFDPVLSITDISELRREVLKLKDKLSKETATEASDQ